MKSIVSLFVFFFIIGFSAFSQVEKVDYELKIKKVDFKTEQEEGLKEAWKSVKIAEKYFKEGLGTYALARDHYLFAHQYNSENLVLNYRIGICYLYTDDKYEALKYLRKSFTNNPNLHPEIEYHLGRAYHLVLEFDKAIEHYKSYRTKAIAQGLIKNVAEIDKMVEECLNGKEIIENPRRVIISNMGDSINSGAADYFSIFSKNDSIIYFTSRRMVEKKEDRNPYDNKFFEDIFYSEIDDEGNWSGAKLLPGRVNSKSNEALVGVSPTGDQLFIYRGENHGGDVLVSKFKESKGVWKSPKKMPRNLRSEQAEGSVYLNTTQDTLYFISANVEYTQGGKDILFTVLDSITRKWSDPKNLGSLVNSVHDEEGIYLSPSGNELYFSSKSS